MAAPKLDHALVLETPQDVADGAGGRARGWVVLGALWAAIRPVGGAERAGQDSALSVQGYRITVRAAPPGAPSRPRPEQRLRHGARLFRIVSVGEPVDGYMTLRAVEETAE